ncbi:hypothetical protein ACLKA6_011809 [Drosophila palustris]
MDKLIKLTPCTRTPLLTIWLAINMALIVQEQGPKRSITVQSALKRTTLYPNMKFLIVFVALFAVALAAPSDVVITKLDSDVNAEGYKFGFETSDGTAHNADAQLKDVGTEHESQVVHGSYSWVDEKTGEKFTVSYVADENGFQPQGAHLPVAACRLKIYL